MLLSMGHHVLLHGRNPVKLKDVETALSGLSGSGQVELVKPELMKLIETTRRE